VYRRVQSLGRDRQASTCDESPALLIGGQRVDPRNMRDALEAVMPFAVQEGLRKKVGSRRCPEQPSDAQDGVHKIVR